jgi:predicted nucleic acid-binding protein
VPSRRVVNASPLILLSKTGQLDLLHLGCADVIVPDAVIVEIEAKGGDDPTAVGVQQASWLSVVPCLVIPEQVRACNLDAGESAVLALAQGDPDCDVVLDDLAARRSAARLRIPCLGTLGLVASAKRLGLIPTARPLVEHLRQNGLYLDDEFAEEVLRRIGE